MIAIFTVHRWYSLTSNNLPSSKLMQHHQDCNIPTICQAADIVRSHVKLQNVSEVCHMLPPLPSAAAASHNANARHRSFSRCLHAYNRVRHTTTTLSSSLATTTSPQPHSNTFSHCTTRFQPQHHPKPWLPFMQIARKAAQTRSVDNPPHRSF